MNRIRGSALPCSRQGGLPVEKRLGFVGIIIEDRAASAAAVNDILSGHGDIILARTGIPRAQGRTCIITLIVDATTDELGRLTGELGRIPGLSVKSGLGKVKSKKGGGE